MLYQATEGHQVDLHGRDHDVVYEVQTMIMKFKPLLPNCRTRNQSQFSTMLYQAAEVHQVDLRGRDHGVFEDVQTILMIF